MAEKTNDYTLPLPKEEPIPRYIGIKPDYDFIDFYSKKDEENGQDDWV